MRAAILWRKAAMLAGAVAGLSCNSGDTGPNVPLAIEFHAPQIPLIVGDVLHDTLGHLDSLRAIVFNSAGDTIPDAPIFYRHADTTHVVTVDSVSGRVTALDTGMARVVAQASTLQSPPETLFVVATPTTFTSTTPLNDTLVFSSVRTDTIFPLSTVLKAGSDPVNHWRIEYHFVYPADLDFGDSTRVLLVDDNRKFSLVDTTGTGTGVAGSATRFLRISPFAHTFNDTVVVEARAFLPDHTPISGSPLRFKVLVQIP